MKSRIMYMEYKGDGLNGSARIGRVDFSKTGRTIHCQGKSFQKVTGYKYNHRDVKTGELYWISGPKKNGCDRLYGGSLPIEINEDAREEYWREIRQQPENVLKQTT